MKKILLIFLISVSANFAQYIVKDKIEAIEDSIPALRASINNIEVGEFTQPDSTVFSSELTAGLATKQDKDADLDNPDIPLDEISDTLLLYQKKADMSGYSATSHTHTEFFDTLSKSIGVMDTVTTGDYIGWKLENNITITEVAGYTNTGTVTFNIKEQDETTPNAAGTDVMASDLVADDNQQETTTFSNSGIARDSWLVLNVASITGDPTIFGVTIRYVKTN